MKYCIFLFFLFIYKYSYEQDIKPFIPEGDAKYYDFWEGTWVELKDDNSLDTSSSFKIARSVNRSCFIEDWHFSNGMKSIGIRTWDKTNNKWGFVWISDNGLFQVWDSKKIDGNWY